LDPRLQTYGVATLDLVDLFLGEPEGHWENPNPVGLHVGCGHEHEETAIERPWIMAFISGLAKGMPPGRR
jgi:hypothetical protein